MATNEFSPTQIPELVQRYFYLALPVSIEDLKRAFRNRSKELHPDAGGDHEEFICMKQVYDLVMSMSGVPGIIRSNGTSKETCTTDGTPLYELGLGLGPTKNGKDCPRCDRRGYTVQFGIAWKVCTECDEFGRVPRMSTVNCKYCGGTGKFTQRRSGRVVDCLACKGTGKFKRVDYVRMQLCPKCCGTKTIHGKSEEKFYHKCFECNGTGEIQIHNPVILKGTIASFSSIYGK